LVISWRAVGARLLPVWVIHLPAMHLHSMPGAASGFWKALACDIHALFRPGHPSQIRPEFKRNRWRKRCQNIPERCSAGLL